MLHSKKITFITIFAITLSSCGDSDESNTPTSALEQRIAELNKQLDSQYEEEYRQAVEKCKELSENPNADPSEVAETEKKITELEAKMGIKSFMGIACKYKPKADQSNE